MAKKSPKQIVIDASVARASGPEEASHPTAKNCRDFLLAVLEFGHHVVFSKAIEIEWNDHQSGFARRWRKSMFARKKIDNADVGENKTFREQIEKAAENDKEKAAMLKDAHLIETARASADRIASLDDAVRELYRKAAPAVSFVRKVCWVNPDNTEEKPVEWLNEGAPNNRFRQFGYALGSESQKSAPLAKHKV